MDKSKGAFDSLVKGSCVMLFKNAALLLSCMVLQACATPAPPQPPENTGDDGRVYRRMLDAALADPAATDWGALRQAYAASPAYDPFPGPGMLHPNAPNAMAYAVRGDWATAARLSEDAATANTMDLQSEILAAAAERHLGQIGAAERHHAIAAGLVNAIQSTGDGQTPATAYHVLATSEEYVLLDVKRLQRGTQALLHIDGHDYDRLTATPSAGGPAVDVWFNIDQSFAREKALLAGLHPISQDALPRS